MKIDITDRPFDPWQCIQTHQRDALEPGSHGAMTVFVGSMRDFNEGDEVQAMELEHYPGMTERFLQRLADEAGQRWSLLDLLIVHRVGYLQPGDPIVLVAVWSAHRLDAYEANRFLMEALKSRAPFWKKEQTSCGPRWVEKNTPGYGA